MEETNWKELWNACNGSVYQSWEWAELNRKSGKEPHFLMIEEKEGLKAGILYFLVKIKTPIGTKTILFSEGTPLAANLNYLQEILKKFKEESRRYWYGTIAPTVIDNDFSAFERAGYTRVDNSTMILNIGKEENELFNGLGRDIRRRIKKIKSDNIQIIRTEDVEDYRKFYDIYSSTMEKGGAVGGSKEFFENLPDLSKIGLASLFVAKKEGRVISGVVILNNGRYGIYNYSGASDEGHENQSNIAALWEAILYLKTKGITLFDMGGYDLEAKPGDKTYSINLFKERFGGEVKEQPVYSTNRKYSFFRSLIKKFRFLKKVYKK